MIYRVGPGTYRHSIPTIFTTMITQLYHMVVPKYPAFYYQITQNDLKHIYCKYIALLAHT